MIYRVLYICLFLSSIGTYNLFGQRSTLIIVPNGEKEPVKKEYVTAMPSSSTPDTMVVKELSGKTDSTEVIQYNSDMQTSSHRIIQHDSTKKPVRYPVILRLIFGNRQHLQVGSLFGWMGLFQRTI